VALSSQQKGISSLKAAKEVNQVDNDVICYSGLEPETIEEFPAGFYFSFFCIGKFSN
jgi:hypothetical protein